MPDAPSAPRPKETIAQGTIRLKEHETGAVFYFRGVINRGREQGQRRVLVEFIVDIETEELIPFNVQPLTA